MTREVVAWVLNLGAEFELMDPDHEPSARLQAETRERARRLVPLIRQATGTDVVALGSETSAGWPPPRRGDCWCPTPGAIARLRAAGVRAPAAPDIEILRRVNHRAFAAALGVALPHAGFETTARDCLSRLAVARNRRWVMKRPFGFSGRMRKVVIPEQMDRATFTWIEASMTGYGLGLQVEPLVERLADFSLHGRLRRDGAAEHGRPVAVECDPDGRFVDARLAARDDLSSGERSALEGGFATAARALGEAGYFGPFGVDALRWRDENGERRFHPLSEINARYSMAWWTGMAPRRD